MTTDEGLSIPDFTDMPDLCTTDEENAFSIGSLSDTDWADLLCSTVHEPFQLIPFLTSDNATSSTPARSAPDDSYAQHSWSGCKIWCNPPRSEISAVVHEAISDFLADLKHTRTTAKLAEEPDNFPDSLSSVDSEPDAVELTFDADSSRESARLQANPPETPELEQTMGLAMPSIAPGKAVSVFECSPAVSERYFVNPTPVYETGCVDSIASVLPESASCALGRLSPSCFLQELHILWDPGGS